MASDVTGLLPHRACRNCVQIKVKCIPREGVNGTSSTCQRCHRLRKECTTPAPVLRKRRRERSSRVAQLEDRINKLTSLLTPKSSPENISITSTVVHDVETIRDDVNAETHTGSTENTEGPSLDESFTQEGSMFLCATKNAPNPAADSTPTPNVDAHDDRLSIVFAPPHLTAQRDRMHATPAEIYPMFLDAELEQSLFEKFCRDMSPSFPFVVIDQDADLALTKRSRPFVFWAACAVASYHKRALHSTLTDQLLKCIGEHVLSKAHKSLDLLQGILILLSWYHYYSHLNPQYVNLLHLAQALAIDLGLNRPSASRSRGRTMADLGDVYHGRQVMHGVRTASDRRAVLGVFVFATKAALCFQRVDLIKFTDHFDKCCRDLENGAEFPSDIYAVQLVRLYQIAEKYTAFDTASTTLPPRFLMRALSDDLRTFQNQLPPSLLGHTELLTEIDACKFCLLGPKHFGDYYENTDAVEPLYASLTSMLDFTDRILALPPEKFMNVPSWFNMSYLIGALAELCFLRIDSWDLELVREKYNFGVIMHRYGEMFEAVQKYGKEIAADELVVRYRIYTDKIHNCIKWYDTKAGMEKGSGSSGEPARQVNFLDDFSGNLFDDLNDPVWDTIVGDWSKF